MLPRKLYELLPYIYIISGIVSATLIDSTIVLISSMLLIVAGAIVLVMRRNFRKSSNPGYGMYQVVEEPDADVFFEKRSGIDRRRRQVSEWPTLDYSGDKIFSDRRIGERRISAV